ncbi:flavodoxin family protein [Kaistia defluvii]|uniref:MioC protein n=1 Tax=Kaistia defluvii TaxID=410841 RepID=A0ABV2QWQ5_9HYPH
MKIIILFGTESGNAELLADEVAEAIGNRFPVVKHDMSETDPMELSPGDFHLVICSTHGEGVLPSGAVPFAAALDRDPPDLRGLRYAMFGLGDHSYDHYARGSEIIDEHLRAAGAERVGLYGRYDASSQDDPVQLACEWAFAVLNEAGHLIGENA